MDFKKVRINYITGVYDTNGNSNFKEDSLNAMQEAYGLSSDLSEDIYLKVLAVNQKSKNVNIQNFISDLELEASSHKIIKDNLKEYTKKGLV